MAMQHGGVDAGSRQRLLDAARDAFAEKGFFATTTRDISAAAGLSPAAVYIHHRSKEAMLYEISRTGHQDILSRLRDIDEADPAARLREMVRAFVHTHAADHTTARVVNYELRALRDEHRASILALRRQIEDCFRNVLAAGVHNGEFSCDDIDMGVNTLLGMGVDVARWFREGKGRTAEQVADHHARMALRMFCFPDPP